MHNRTVDTQELTGERYDLGSEEYIFVFPGLAYSRHLIGGENPYYNSVNPAHLTDATEDAESSTTVTKTIYSDDEGAYVYDDAEIPSYSITRYLIDDIVYKYDERISVVNDDSYSDEADNLVEPTECIKLTNGWSDVDDITLRIEDLDAGLEDGSIKPLWPVWRGTKN